jgi:hypothetical protein
MVRSLVVAVLLGRAMPVAQVQHLEITELVEVVELVLLVLLRLLLVQALVVWGHYQVILGQQLIMQVEVVAPAVARLVLAKVVALVAKAAAAGVDHLPLQQEQLEQQILAEAVEDLTHQAVL